MKNILLKGFLVSASILFVTSSVSAMTCTTLTKTLSKGSENSEVLKLQKFLFDGGYLTVKPNGYFGNGTVAAVKKFQRVNGLAQVGLVGPGTRGKVKGVSCGESKIPTQAIKNTQTQNITTQKTDGTKLVSDTFINNLNSCTKYKESFVHPMTGVTLNREILGIIDGKCDYVEQMPNNGKMECKYTESMRIAAAKYYKETQAPSTVDVNVTTDFSSTNVKTKVNGVDIKNPLQEAINTKVCVISGY